MLKDQPKNAQALYGRGVDKARLGRAAEGQADIAVTTAIRPTIAEESRALGVEL